MLLLHRVFHHFSELVGSAEFTTICAFILVAATFVDLIIEVLTNCEGRGIHRHAASSGLLGAPRVLCLHPCIPFQTLRAGHRRPGDRVKRDRLTVVAGGC